MAAEYVVRMGQRIAQRREELRMSQNDLARELPGKVSGQQVSKWERGIHEPRAETLEAIGRILRVPVAYFMLDEPKPGTPDLMGALAPNGDGAQNDPASTLRALLEAVLRIEDLLRAQASEEALRIVDEAARRRQQRPDDPPAGQAAEDG